MTNAIALLCAVLIASATLAATTAWAGEPDVKVRGPVKGDQGIIIWTVESPFQYGPNAIEVLLPDKMEPERKYPVLYVLPVIPGRVGGEFGNSLLEIKRLDLANKHQVICVSPAFDRVPWYADHPTNPKIRQESYLLKVVLPLIEEKYPAIAAPEGRLLIGFSKSGWGAFTLLLRHPDVFGGAASWDAPMAGDKPRYAMDVVVATQENFEKYHVMTLLEQRAELLKKQPRRLVLMGHDIFGAETEKVHQRMLALGIPHEYDNAVTVKHRWDTGWMEKAVERLMAPATK